MRLWNTRTRRKDRFTADEVVRLYVCGVTPYATTHLGHARTYVVFDVLIRELERQGFRVRYVQNVTDVDDPLFERAKELGRTTADLAAEFTRVFQGDMAVLGIRPPDVFPHASDEIPAMQRIVAELHDREYAYTRDDYVYFRVRSFHRYGELSRLPRSQMIAIAGERGEDPSDPRKEDPLDFMLWKPSRPGEDSWPSPVPTESGCGRPGWHIECSAMALKHLGPVLDIHGGGSDLIYPHHENEIAQSEACTGRAPFARFWVHVEMVRLGGIKMSKSLGNVIMVRDVVPEFGPLALRHYLLNTHYRTPLEYARDDLRASATRTARLGQALREPRQVAATDLTAHQARFDTALVDDLDTPSALAALDSAVQVVLDAPLREGQSEGQRVLQAMAARVGLVNTSPTYKVPTNEALTRKERA